MKVRGFKEVREVCGCEEGVWGMETTVWPRWVIDVASPPVPAGGDDPTLLRLSGFYPINLFVQ